MSANAPVLPMGRRGLLSTVAASGAVSLPGIRGAMAQSSSRPIRLVYPSPPGGAGDALARVLATQLTRLLQQTVIVENRSGATGRIGAAFALNAEPNGEVLLFSPIGAMVFLPVLDPNVDYNPREATTLAQVATYDSALVVGRDLGPRSFDEFVAWLRANPRRAFCGLAGGGGLQHMFMISFARQLGLTIDFVPYRGSAPLMNALVAGEVPFAMVITGEATALHAQNRLRILATSGAERSSLLPEVPTLKEARLDLEGHGWFGLFGPPRLPPAIASTIETAALTALRSEEFRRVAQQFGYVPTALDGGAMQRILQADIDRWGPVVRASGHTPNL